jgi:hypothetical protein
MKLFSVVITLFGKPGELELLVPAFDQQTAENKTRFMVANGKMYIPTEHKRFNERTNSEEIVRGREQIYGYVQSCTATEAHHTAFPRRTWNEKTGKFHYPCPRNRCCESPIKETAAAADRIASFRSGWLVADEQYSARASLETRLKKAIKSLNDSILPAADFESGFRKLWDLRASRKPVAVKKAKRTKKTLAVA